MRKERFSKAITHSVLRLLDNAARKHGLAEVKHAATKWTNGQRDKARLLKEQAALTRELAEVSKRLSK